MARVDELQKKYPNLPREIIIKWDTMNMGIIDTEALDKVAFWDRSGSYQSRDLHGVTMKGISGKRPEIARPGFVMRPGEFYMKNGMGARIARSLSSPYEIRDLCDGQFALYEGDEKVEDLYFVGPRPPSEEPLTCKGTPVTSLIAQKGRCFSIYPVRHCEFFTRGDQCKFCNYNNTYEDARAVGKNPPVTISLEETLEAYEIVASKTRLVEGRFQSGAFRSNEQEAKTYMGFVEKIASGAAYKPNLTLHGQPMDRKDMLRLKDAGLSCVTFQPEVWEPQLFAEVCPGKARRDGYEGYLEAFLEAVDVFGAGGVAATFVGGVSLMPPNGHETYQESRDSLVEAFRWNIRNGVFPYFLALRLGVGSIYGDDPSNQAKLPPTDYYLELALAHHELMLDYGLYPKLNKLMLCPLDCLAPLYGGELGILALAGNVGNWVSDAIPADANWLAKFIASVQPSASTIK